MMNLTEIDLYTSEIVVTIGCEDNISNRKEADKWKIM